MGFEIVDGSSNCYRVIVKQGRGQGDVAQVRCIGFGYGFGSLDNRWSYDRLSTLVRRKLSIKVDNVDD